MLNRPCKISDGPNITFAFIAVVLPHGDLLHTVDFVHVMVKFDKQAYLIEPGYIRKGVMIDGLW